MANLRSPVSSISNHSISSRGKFIFLKNLFQITFYFCSGAVGSSDNKLKFFFLHIFRFLIQINRRAEVMINNPCCCDISSIISILNRKCSKTWTGLPSIRYVYLYLLTFLQCLIIYDDKKSIFLLLARGGQFEICSFSSSLMLKADLWLYKSQEYWDAISNDWIGFKNIKHVSPQVWIFYFNEIF